LKAFPNIRASLIPSQITVYKNVFENRALMNNRKGTSKEIEELAKRIVPILCDGGVIEASVFGSFTRGEVQPDSDLDLLVRYKETVSLFDVGGLKCELEKLLGIKVDLISRDYLKPRIKKRILEESYRIL
jgi:predicted nucleotidyltransferase